MHIVKTRCTQKCVHTSFLTTSLGRCYILDMFANFDFLNVKTVKNSVPNVPCHFLRTAFFTVFTLPISLYGAHKAHRKKNGQKHEKTCFWRKNQVKNVKNGHFWWKNHVRQKSSLRLISALGFWKGTSESQLEIFKKHVFWPKCTKKHTCTYFFMAWQTCVDIGHAKTIKNACFLPFLTCFWPFLTLFSNFFMIFKNHLVRKLSCKNGHPKNIKNDEKWQKMVFSCFLCTFVFFITPIGLPNVQKCAKSCKTCQKRHFNVFWRTRTCFGVHDR